MKQLINILFLLPYVFFAQVGIGTTTPNPDALLDVESTNQGILIPRVALTNSTNTAPLSTHVAGMIVYNTATTGDVAPGFYYNDGTKWATFSGIKRINDLLDGKSDNDGSEDGSSIFLGINAGTADDSSNNKNVGVGFQSLQSNSTGMNNVSIGYQGLRSNVLGDANTAIGDYAGRALDYTNITDNDNDFNVFIGSKAGDSDFNSSKNVYIGVSAGGGDYDPYTSTGTAENKSGNVFIGYQSGYNESGSNKLYIENSNAGSDNALIYGEFDTNILRTNGTLQINNPSSGGYQFPTVDGTAGQTLVTNGSGTLTFQDIPNPLSNFSLVRASAAEQTPTSTYQIIDYNAESFDTNGEFDISTDTFTALYTGYYKVEAIISSTYHEDGGTGPRELAISVNGTKVSRVVFNHTGNGRLVRQISDIIQLTSGDTLNIVVDFNGDNTIILTDGGSGLSHLTIQRIR